MNRVNYTTINTETLGLSIQLTRHGHRKLSHLEVEKFVEDTLRHFQKSLTTLPEAKIDFHKFCEGEPLYKNMCFDRQTSICERQQNLNDTLVQDDDNDLQETDNHLPSHKKRIQRIDRIPSSQFYVDRAK